jgi:hypothetical protein
MLVGDSTRGLRRHSDSASTDQCLLCCRQPFRAPDRNGGCVIRQQLSQNKLSLYSEMMRVPWCARRYRNSIPFVMGIPWAG